MLQNRFVANRLRLATADGVVGHCIERIEDTRQ